MANKLWVRTMVLASTLALSGCQTPLKSTVLNQSIEESPINLVPDTPDSDGDGVLDDIDNCPNTPENVPVDKRGCPFWGPMSLKMEYRAFFPKGSSDLLPEYQLELDKIAKQMNKYDTAIMKIEAHSSEDEIYKELSSLPKNRALMVKNYLVLKHDIEPTRLSTFNCGARAPIALSDTEEGKSMNRRVYGLATEPEGERAYQQPNNVASTICVEF